MLGKKRYLAMVLAGALAATACSEANKQQREQTVVEDLTAQVEQALNKGAPTAAANIIEYQCENGKSLQAEYINNDSGQSAKITYDGKTFDMYSTRAASGAKYATEQGLTPNDGLIWWSQRNEGMLMTMILDHTVKAEDHPIITKCAQAN